MRRVLVFLHTTAMLTSMSFHKYLSEINPAFEKKKKLVTVAAGLLKSAVLHSHDESEEGRNPKANTSHLISISESQSLF